MEDGPPAASHSVQAQLRLREVAIAPGGFFYEPSLCLEAGKLASPADAAAGWAQKELLMAYLLEELHHQDCSVEAGRDDGVLQLGSEGKQV